MRQLTHDKAVSFRVAGVIIRQLAAEADRRGMSLSELAREALRQRAGLH